MNRSLNRPAMKGWLVHSLTALGAVCGMFGLIAVGEHRAEEAILWLVVAMVLDGVDGPVARAWRVDETVPRIDGYALDLVVDFVTCIVIPVLFMHQFQMLPEGWSLLVGAFMLFTSALWMSRTDQTTDDHFFNGFPGEWNMIVPSLYLLEVPAWVTGTVCVILALSQFGNWKFVHPVQVRRLRPATISVTVLWLATILYMTADLPNHSRLGAYALVLCPAYVLGIGAWRTLGAAPEPVAATQPAVAGAN